MERVGFLRSSGTAFQTVGPETENDREPTLNNASDYRTNGWMECSVRRAKESK